MTEWEATQQRIVRAWSRQRFDDAFAEIARVLAGGPPSHQAEALIYRAMIWETRGDLKAAANDYGQAVALALEGSYSRYAAQQGLGEAQEKLGSHDEAKQSYRAALRTAVENAELSGARALKGFLVLNAAHTLSEKDYRLASAVAQQSWRALRLPGTPDLADLMATAERLVAETTKEH